jgi:hypothetical protein
VDVYHPSMEAVVGRPSRTPWVFWFEIYTNGADLSSPPTPASSSDLWLEHADLADEDTWPPLQAPAPRRGENMFVPSPPASQPPLRTCSASDPTAARQDGRRRVAQMRCHAVRDAQCMQPRDAPRAPPPPRARVRADRTTAVMTIMAMTTAGGSP